MMVRDENFSGQVTPAIVAAEYQDCNFTQAAPVSRDSQPAGVRLFPGDDMPRRFVRCNLTNAEPPPGSVLIECNTTLKEWFDVEDEAKRPLEAKGERIFGRFDATQRKYIRRSEPEVILPPGAVLSARESSL